jgi:hypothetical protein
LQPFVQKAWDTFVLQNPGAEKRKHLVGVRQKVYRERLNLESQEVKDEVLRFRDKEHEAQTGAASTVNEALEGGLEELDNDEKARIIEARQKQW